MFFFKADWKFQFQERHQQLRTFLLNLVHNLFSDDFNFKKMIKVPSSQIWFIRMVCVFCQEYSAAVEELAVKIPKIGVSFEVIRNVQETGELCRAEQYSKIWSNEHRYDAFFFNLFWEREREMRTHRQTDRQSDKQKIETESERGRRTRKKSYLKMDIAFLLWYLLVQYLSIWSNFKPKLFVHLKYYIY